MKKTKKSGLYKFYLKCYKLSKQDEYFNMADIIDIVRRTSEFKNQSRIKKHNIVKLEEFTFGSKVHVGYGNKRTGKVMYYQLVN